MERGIYAGRIVDHGFDYHLEHEKKGFAPQAHSS